MRKIAAAFLLFVSFNLFAEKHEIGRLIVEIRDYEITNKSPEWVFPPYSGPYIINQYDMIVTSTFTKEYPLVYEDVQKYLDRYIHKKGDGEWLKLKSFPDKRIITWQYDPIDSGRWRILWYLFPTLFGQNEKIYENTSVYILGDAFDVFAQCLVITAEKRYYPGVKFGWYHTLDLNEEEFYYIHSVMNRKDENGRPMHSFNVQFVFWSEK
jgi:hypothetical protein